jgi:hypothetical protein
MTADSRLNHMRATLDAANEVVAEMFTENLDPHDAISLARAEKFILAAGQAVAAMSIYSPVVGVEPPECGNYNSVGSRCVRPQAHADSHRASHGFEWDEQSDAAAAKAIADSMKGITNG